jgi:hypothetical protein
MALVAPAIAASGSIVQTNLPVPQLQEAGDVSLGKTKETNEDIFKLKNIQIGEYQTNVNHGPTL